ncbi:Aste57867_10624 [Aphanomyces stellatus]|uniref:Aste57867_10624 protein n=1 Tax=Aphanomyces stellatus TaxID=120398 RepID=A0A485KRJ3_9STRA|nr:hypothetical protein As57867_010584 [Aphanomyces stellatus]VFT87496.1 Aste57867_10624 [Aphanomyces stellatus]
MTKTESPHADDPIDAASRSPSRPESPHQALEAASFEDAATLGAFATRLTVTPSKQDEPTTDESEEAENDDDQPNFPDWVLECFANTNYGIPKVEVLTGRVGYLEWPCLVTLALCKDTVVSVINLVSNTDALIVDLRACVCEDPDTADLLYIRPTNTTKPRVVGQKDNYTEHKRNYFGKPVYVLTSTSTFLCGEKVAYTLQSFGKAQVVGTAKTGDGAHHGEDFYLHPYLSVFIPTEGNINMKTGTDWEGDSVAPDVQVATPEEGLDVAHAFALKQILTRRRDKWSKKDFMAPYIQKLEAKLTAYILKTFEIATIVGTAKTGGWAYPDQLFYLHPYWGVLISTGRNINTNTGTDWEGDGVAPHVQVATPDQGLDVAHALALKQILARRRDEWSKKDFMAPYIQQLEAKLSEL